ncbi:MAG: hypothetical protein R3F13_01370 [Prosthecobacter sp.]
MMVVISRFLIVAGLLFGTGLAQTNDVSSYETSVRIEAFELPVADAFNVQKIMSEGTAAERQEILQRLREEGAAGKVKAVAKLEGKGMAGEKLELGSGSPQTYPTGFRLTGGLAMVVSTEVRKTGWLAELEIATEDDQEQRTVTAYIRHTEMDGSRRHRASKTDAQGSFEQPIFASVSIQTRLVMRTGEPRLAGIFTPTQTEQPVSNLGVVILTLEP